MKVSEACRRKADFGKALCTASFLAYNGLASLVMYSQCGVAPNKHQNYSYKGNRP